MAGGLFQKGAARVIAAVPTNLSTGLKTVLAGMPIPQFMSESLLRLAATRAAEIAGAAQWVGRAIRLADLRAMSRAEQEAFMRSKPRAELEAIARQIAEEYRAETQTAALPPPEAPQQPANLALPAPVAPQPASPALPHDQSQQLEPTMNESSTRDFYAISTPLTADPVANTIDPAPDIIAQLIAAARQAREAREAVPSGELVNLSFKVPPLLRNQFKATAKDAGLSQVDLLVEAFELWTESRRR